MRLIFGLVLIVGIGLAGFAVYMARDFIGGYQAQLDAERALAASREVIPTEEVFVLNEPVKYGQQITEESIRLVKFPTEAIPEGVFRSVEEVFPEGEPKFRTVIRAMEKNEALLGIKVSKPGADAGVASRLSEGMRAFTIRVDVTTGVSGFLRPGDRVDVYWTGRGRNELGDAEALTKLIQSNVPLIAVDQVADNDRTAPSVARTVTVEVTPRQVAALAQAQSSGRLTLALVGARDQTTSDNIEVGQGEIIGEFTAPEARRCTVRTRRGAEIIETVIPCPE